MIWLHELYAILHNITAVALAILFEHVGDFDFVVYQSNFIPVMLSIMFYKQYVIFFCVTKVSDSLEQNSPKSILLYRILMAV